MDLGSVGKVYCRLASVREAGLSATSHGSANSAHSFHTIEAVFREYETFRARGSEALPGVGSPINAMN